MRKKKVKLNSLFPFILIFCLFIVPFVMAWFFYHHQHWLPGAKNNGRLLQPPVRVASLALRDMNGKPMAIKKLLGKWSMLYISLQQCDETCFNKLFYLRQIRKLLGVDGSRVQVVLSKPLLEDSRALSHMVAQDYSGILNTQLSLDKLKIFLKDTKSRYNSNQHGYLYLVDPLGNVMMVYPDNANPKGILQDMKLLLKASQIG